MRAGAGELPNWPLLSIDRRQSGTRACLTAVGEVDISSADALRRAFAQARECGASEIWLDLTHTTFLDCNGLRLLLDARADLLEENRRLVLVCPPGPVHRLLVMTGADRTLEIHSTAPRECEREP